MKFANDLPATGNKPGALWKRVNAQHGLLDWSFGELYSIPDSSSSRLPEPDRDRVTVAWLPPMILPANMTLAVQVLAPVPVPVSVHVPVVVTSALAERVKLTPDQAIHIFKLGRTKSKDTASLLATEFGITSKAIRDIWTRRSWGLDTRPYWNDYQVVSHTAFVSGRRGT